MNKRFADAMQANNLVLVVGAGVSAGATRGESNATWRGLLQSGITRVGAVKDPRWIDLQTQALEYAFEDGNMAMLLGVAQSISAELKSISDAAYGAWLSDTIGQLAIRERELLEAITSLPFPILTTNYDTLLDKERGTAVWTRPSEVQAALTGKTNAVVHLHGVWTEPDSVILTDADYERVTASEVTQTLQRAVSSLHTMVYVGFGAGLDDPNFSRLIEWHSHAFAASSVSHFVLCRADDEEKLQALHLGDHLVPVVYGTHYEDLPLFMAQLRPRQDSVALSDAGIVQDLVGDIQFELERDMIADSVIGEGRSDLEGARLADVVLPPILLPVPYAEHLQARKSRPGDPSVDRVDPKEVAHGHDVILLVGDSDSGLSTAVRWIALEASRYLGGAAPFAVSFRACRPSATPLQDQLIAAARAAGMMRTGSKTLPPHVIALDDFSVNVRTISERVLRELSETDALCTVIGCATGSEDDVVERFRAIGIKASVKYIGRLSSGDVRTMARMASPVNAERLTTTVLDIVQSENLPRTPYTIALMISVLARSGAISPQTSQTSVLDDYIGMLLGRGDPHDDARLGLDQGGREAVLARLAQGFFEQRVGGMLEAEAIETIQDAFDRFGWKDRPAEVVQNFIRRGILRTDGRHISFARSSYLHLFAAKRAGAAASFRSSLLSDPLFYASALSHYAALNRHDDELVPALLTLLTDVEWNHSSGGVFADIPQMEPFIETDMADRAEEAIAETDERSPVPENHDIEDEWFDNTGDEDRPPFPITDHEDLPPVSRLMRAIDLVSKALRDTDQVENVPKKQELLMAVFDHWGLLLGMMAEDVGFRDVVRQTVSEVDDAKTGDPDQLEELVEEWSNLFAASMTAGGVAVALASRRLSVALERSIDDETVRENEPRAVAAAFFVLALEEDGWVSQMREVLKSHRNMWVVRRFLLILCLGAFLDDRTSSREANDLLELCLDLAQRGNTYKSNEDEARHRDQLRQGYLRDRTRARAKRLSGRPKS